MDGGEKRSKMRIEIDTFIRSILDAYVLCCAVSAAVSVVVSKR